MKKTAKRPKRETAPRKRRPHKLPDFFVLPRQDWQALFKLVRWLDDTPASVELGDHLWTSIQEQLCDAIPNIQIPRDHTIINIELESAEYARRPEDIGKLVALVDDFACGADNQHRVPVLWAVSG